MIGSVKPFVLKRRSEPGIYWNGNGLLRREVHIPVPNTFSPYTCVQALPKEKLHPSVFGIPFWALR